MGDGTVFLALLLTVGVLVIRYFVWRGRYKDILRRFEGEKAELTQMRSEINDLTAALARIEARRGEPRPAVKSNIDVVVPSSTSQWRPLTEPAVNVVVEPANEKSRPPVVATLDSAKAYRIWKKAGAMPPRRPQEPRKPGRLQQVARSFVRKLSLAGADWEEMIGGRWLAFIGIVVLVIGMTMLIGQAWYRLTPGGRVALGVAVSAALLAGGVALGRRQKYLPLARALLGGGWALLYFVAYAAHNVAQAKIIDNSVLSLALLIAVAAGMILHTFLYRSQLVTGLAYALGFLAVAMSPPTLFSLVASAVLAASLVAVLRLFPWHLLVSVGVAGTYLNHWRWLSENEAVWRAGPPTEALHGYIISVGILVLYWLIYVAASFARRPFSESDRYAHYAITGVNAAGFLFMTAWQMTAFKLPQLHFLTALGCPAFAAVALLDRRLSDRPTFLFNATLALSLYVVTPVLLVMEIGASANWVALYWGVSGVSALAIGTRWRDAALRGEGYLVLALAAIAAFAVNLATNLWLVSLWQWLAAPLVIVALHAVTGWLQRIERAKWVNVLEPRLKIPFAVVAIALVGRLLWTFFLPTEIGLIWVIVGLLYWEVGVRGEREFARVQGVLLAAAGAFAVLAFNLVPSEFRAEELPRLLPKVWVEALVVAILYLGEARLMMVRARIRTFEAGLFGTVSTVATLLLALTVIREARAEFVGAFWALAALVLTEVGLRVREQRIAAQGYLLLWVSACAVVVVNVYELLPVFDATSGTLSFAGPAFVAMAFVLVYTQRVRVAVAWPSSPKAISRVASPIQIVDALSWAASLLAALILWKELPSIAVAVAWTLASVVIFQTAPFGNLRAQRIQASLLMIAAVGRLFFANFTAPDEIWWFSFASSFWTPSQRLVSVVPVIVSLFYLRARLLASASDDAGQWFSPSWFAPRLLSYLAALLIFALARFEFGRDLAVLGWSAVALVFLRLGLALPAREFCVQAYGFGVLAFARSFSSSVFLVGSFYGVPERVAITVPVIATLAFISWVNPPGQKRDAAAGALSRTRRWMIALESNPKPLFATLASALVTIFIFYQSSAQYVSIGWAISALAMIAFGFAISERAYRLFGLALLAVTLLKLTIFDLAGVDTLYRIASFIVLGVILLLASLGYSRHRSALNKLL